MDHFYKQKENKLRGTRVLLLMFDVKKNKIES